LCLCPPSTVFATQPFLRLSVEQRENTTLTIFHGEAFLLGFLDLGLAGERIPAVLDALAGFALGLTACIGIATLIVAWGLWKLKPWAFWVHRLQLCTMDATEQAEREEVALVRRLQFVRWLVRTGRLTEQIVRKGEPAEEHEGALEPVEEISLGSLRK